MKISSTRVRRRVYSGRATLVMVLALTGAGCTGPWTLFRHDNRRTGLSTVDTSQDKGFQRWRYTPVSKTGAAAPFVSSPALDFPSDVYIGSRDGGLYAVTVAGAFEWRFATGAGVDSSPAVESDGTIYVGSDDGNLYAIDDTGNQEWLFPTGGAIISSPVRVGYENSDNQLQLVIYIGSEDGNLYAVNAGSGTELWHYSVVYNIDSSPAVGGDGTIYFGADNGILYAVNPDSTGKWMFLTHGAISSAPAIAGDGTIYAGSHDGNLYAINPDGSQKWLYNISSAIYSSPAIGTDGTVYVGANDKALYAITAAGKLKWKFVTGASIYSSPAIGGDGAIYVGSEDANLYAVNASGKQIWKFATAGPISHPPQSARKAASTWVPTTVRCTRFTNGPNSCIPIPRPPTARSLDHRDSARAPLVNLTTLQYAKRMRASQLASGKAPKSACPRLKIARSQRARCYRCFNQVETIAMADVRRSTVRSRPSTAMTS